MIGEFEAGSTNGYILKEILIWPFAPKSFWSPLPVSHYKHSNPACTEARIKSEIGIVVLSGNLIEMLVHRSNIRLFKNAEINLEIRFLGLMDGSGINFPSPGLIATCTRGPPWD